MKRLVIDARMWGNTGIGTYLQHLLSELDAVTDIEIVALVLPSDVGRTTFARIKKVPLNANIYSVKEQLLVPLTLRRLRPDLVHFPHINVPLLYSKPFVLTVHDLITLRSVALGKRLFKRISQAIKKILQIPVIRLAVARAQTVIVPSEAVAAELAKTFPSPHSLRIIREGVALPLASGQLPAGISQPYVLFVGNLAPHKNVANLIKAWQLLPATAVHHGLVIAGEGSELATLKELASNLAAPVLFTGRVDADTLGALYQNAALFAFPSLSEGFGLPPLEAMSYGVPVISSKASVMPEILGEAALYFDPENPTEIADQISRVLDDPDLASTLRRKGYEQIKRYSWEKMAEETLAIYKAVL